jgi:hypothetical protein
MYGKRRLLLVSADAFAAGSLAIPGPKTDPLLQGMTSGAVGRAS